MFIYNIKIALRVLLKSKLFTWVNVIGLAMALSSCLVIASVVVDEFSYDRFWSRADDVYRLVSVYPESSGRLASRGGSVNAALAPALKEHFPEVEEYAMLYLAQNAIKIRQEDQQMITTDFIEADSAVYDLLDIKLINAEPDLTPVKGLPKIIVSESFAKKHFMEGNALGRSIYMAPRYEEKSVELRVVGVMEDLPYNTMLYGDIVYLNTRQEETLVDKDFFYHRQHFICLKPGTDASTFEAKMNDWYAQLGLRDSTTRFALQSIKDAYLKSDFPVNQLRKGNMKHLYIFSMVSLLILIIACVNYINLSTARANKRLQEMAVRKVLGASRKQLVYQYLLETGLIFLFSCTVCILVYPFAIRWIVDFIGHPLEVTLLTNWKFFMGAILFLSSVFLLTVLYPAWHISGFQPGAPISTLLNRRRRAHQWFRKGLVIFQFSISVIVLIAMVVVQQQFDYMQEKDVGYEVEGLIAIGDVSWDGKAAVFKNELSKLPELISSSYSTWLPTQGTGYMSRKIEHPDNPDNKMELWYIAAEVNFAETLGLHLKQGRFLSDSLQTDVIEATDYEGESNTIRPVLMSSSTAKAIGIQQLNRQVDKIDPVGIVQDFNTESFHKKTVPTVIVGYKDPDYSGLLLRVRPGMEERVMKQVNSIWQRLFPYKPLSIDRVEDTLREQYVAEAKLQTLFRFFSTLSMVLAILGLFGLVVSAVDMRVKEIGIRKVLGASVISIVGMLSNDFVKLVIIGIVIASPFGWWLMNEWLQDYAYSIEVRWWVFVFAGLIALSTALATVSIQTVKAARANPVDSLRDE